MKFFKLELLNREENFNKMFNRTPNVGVMQVVKPKAPATGSTPTAAASTTGSAAPSARKTTSVGVSGMTTPTSDGSGLPPLGPSAVSNSAGPAVTPARVGSGGAKK